MFEACQNTQQVESKPIAAEGAVTRKPESSFDSGYSTSLNEISFGISPSPGPSGVQTTQIVMDHNRIFMASPLKGTGSDSNHGIISLSPIKVEMFSPFKDNPLSPFKDSPFSPFKLINQSPSKGALDEWDKDFLANFQDNLFGDASLIDEWFKSPKGKSLLENRNSPLRSRNSAVRQLRISPENKHRKQNFQPLHDNAELFSAVLIKDEPMETRIKEENTSHDHEYGQCVNPNYTNTLCAIDPNKMSDTPIKPRFTSIENAPIRKLSMRIPGGVGSVPAIVTQKENIPQQQVWPSKEKLKYARLQFREVLNRAVEKELAIMKEAKRKLAEQKKRRENRLNKKAKCDSASVVHTGGVVSKQEHRHGGKVSRGGKGKGKYVRKVGRKDKYPEIKMALSKPVKQEEDTIVVHRELFPPADFTDPGWYPSDDDEDDDTWSGPPPLFKQSSVDIENSDSDSDWNPSSYQYETLSGRRVKKRKLY